MKCHLVRPCREDDSGVFRLERVTCVSSTCVTPTPPGTRTTPSDSARKARSAGPSLPGRGEMEVTGSAWSITTEGGASRASVSLPGEAKQLRLTLNWIFFLFLISLKKCKEPREEHLRFSIKHLTGSQSCHIPPGTPQHIVSHLDWKWYIIEKPNLTLH